MPDTPTSLPPDEYRQRVNDAIDAFIKKIREGLAKGVTPERAATETFMRLWEADHDPESDRIHGLAAGALVRLAQALEIR